MATDWGERSEVFDHIKSNVANKDLSQESEAQTRYDIINPIIEKFLGWQYGQVKVEVHDVIDKDNTFVDYLLISGDIQIVVEAKKVGSTFTTPTQKESLKLNGAVLSKGDVRSAINQALNYARNKAAQITMVTNGLCWIFLKTSEATENRNPDVYFLFPFEKDKDAEKLFQLFNEATISKYGLSHLPEEKISVSGNKLINVVSNSEFRVGRNNIADHISPAIEQALYAESFASDPDYLRKYYVTTTARTRFDKTLSIHLVDTKSKDFGIVKRIKQNTSKKSELEEILSVSRPSHAPPVTLIIAPVGVGKSTYLKHFQYVKGKDLIEKNKVRWIYIDFYSMGTSGDVRKFIYSNLLDYLNTYTDYKNVIEPAYKNEIDGLKKGILSLLSNEETISEEIFKHIKNDYNNIEPYVDKVFKYISQRELCVLVLDNIDLHEDIDLEKKLMSEGLAISRRLFCNVIISIRDTTYSQHQNDTLFDAFELRKLWLDPPPFKEVLSKRFLLSKNILKGKSVDISFENGMVLKVKDLSDFFEIVQSSLLAGKAGDFIEALSAQNTRKGLELANNFLTSGHIHADKALKTYMMTQDYHFPFHEIFKGTVLGQWKYYKENRLKCLNLFDSRLNAKNLRLLRLYIISYLYSNARDESTLYVSVKKCFELFSQIGANTEQIMFVINDLMQYGLVKTSDAKPISKESVVYLTRTGGYYLVELSGRFNYVESCLYDTIIDDIGIWNKLSAATKIIETEDNSNKRMYSRKRRVIDFLNYMITLEDSMSEIITTVPNWIKISHIKEVVSTEIDFIFNKNHL